MKRGATKRFLASCAAARNFLSAESRDRRRNGTASDEYAPTVEGTRQVIYDALGWPASAVYSWLLRRHFVRLTCGDCKRAFYRDRKKLRGFAWRALTPICPGCNVIVKSVAPAAGGTVEGAA